MTRSRQFLRFIVIAFLFTVGAAAQSKAPECAYPKDPDIYYLTRQAKLAEGRSEFLNAINWYIKVLELEPNNECVTNMVSELFGKMRYFQQQEMWANRAIGLNPNFVPAYISLGNAQIGMQDVEEAKRTFKKASQAAPKDPLSFFSLGMLADDEKKYSEAIANYKRAIDLDPDFEDAYYNLAGVYIDTGKNVEAKKLLNKLLEINPNARDAKAMLQKIQ